MATATHRRGTGRRTRRGRRGHWQSFKELVRRWVRLFDEHDLLTYASAIAFQALVAFVALVLLFVAVLGEIGRDDVWTNQIGPRIEPKVLHPVYAGLNATVEKIFHSSSLGLIAFAAFVTVWEISGVVRALMGALARIYNTEDERPWWVRMPLSVAMALVLTAALVGSILLATAAQGAVHGAWGVAFGVLRWLLSIVLVALAFGILVRFAPVERRTKKWASAGAALVVVAWVVQTLLFAEYLETFANYRSAAGSLLGVYFLTTYLYVGAIVLLVAIELDELLRKDVEGDEDRGILELVRGVL
jgi:membrane protein